MKHPFEHLSAASIRRVYWIFLGLTGVVTLLMGEFGKFHPDAASDPNEIRTVPTTRMEFFKTTAEWETTLAAIGKNGTAALQRQTYLDYLFLCTYSTLLAAAVIGVTRGVKHTGVIMFARWLAWGQWLSGVLDGVENYGLLHNAAGPISEGWAVTSSYCAMLKFALIIVGTLYVFVQLAQSWRDEA